MAIDEGVVWSEMLDLKKREHYFSQAVNEYSERIYWHIRKMVISHDDANDVLQNTFLKAWRGLDSFRGDCKFSTWLYRIATNETLTFLSNKKQQQYFSIDEDDSSQLLNVLESDKYIDGDELQMILQKAVLTLPDKQRLVFNMRYFDELSYEEMNDILGTSVGALKASYHHAVKKIEKYIANCNIDVQF